MFTDSLFSGFSSIFLCKYTVYAWLCVCVYADVYVVCIYADVYVVCIYIKARGGNGCFLLGSTFYLEQSHTDPGAQELTEVDDQ